jgi:predicted HAD superfamily Cof-like phosphohydrolase
MSYLIFKDQIAFMRAFGQEASPDMAALYRRLCEEEHGELAVAWEAYEDDPSAENTAEVVDACIDSIYVLSGLIHALGLDPQPLWDEVHRSNIDKIKHLCVECSGTGSVSAYRQHLDAFEYMACPDCRGQGHLYEVRRRDDGKVLKPDGWRPPDLLSIVRAARNKP